MRHRGHEGAVGLEEEPVEGDRGGRGPDVARGLEGREAAQIQVVEDLDAEVEEAASVLGAGRWQAFRRVILPMLVPPALTGFTLAFARAVGEYGSVVFISSNIPLETEIAPRLIFARLEAFEYKEAAAIAVVLLAASFALLIAVNVLERWSRRHDH